MIEVSEIKQKFYRLQGKKQQVESDLASHRVYLDNLSERMKLVERAQTFLQKVAQETQSKLTFQVEDIVNLALNTCFPDEYRFQLRFNVSRGKTTGEMSFISQKTGRAVDPVNASGGGVVDITSFALRIAAYALERGMDNVMILDEPMKFVSKDLQARVGDILKTLSEKLNLQILMVTHINEMVDVADRVFEVKKNPDGRSVVKVRKNI